MSNQLQGWEEFSKAFGNVHMGKKRKKKNQFHIILYNFILNNFILPLTFNIILLN